MANAPRYLEVKQVAIYDIGINEHAVKPLNIRKHMSNANIEIEVETLYHEQQSQQQAARFVFSYNIKITNHGKDPIKLVSRYWHITDGREKIQEVNGQGVIGQQPKLTAGESFEYSSGIILQTPTGIMQGHYDFVTDKGEVIEAPIPAFTLASPTHLH